MSDEPPSPAEIAAFARRHGLGGLTGEQLARLGELAVPVAQFGQAVRRAPRKEDAPAGVFRVSDHR